MERRGAQAVILGLACAVTLVLAGCTETAEPRTTGTESPPGETQPAASTAPPSGDDEPTPGMERPAAESLALFDSVNEAVIAADPDAGGRDFIDALVAAGFDRSAMQVTSDTTTLGDRADSIQFAVGLGPDCLIGQYGPKSDGYRSAVRPALGTGGCLIGDTRPIDW
ncbi:MULTISPECIES: DUF6993 domain-containing protein [unclassified Agromyces]|uniref:DUF6993 domain-containing protein n=1 Tax=unclassified Agromyces TaxID=2639701 RepID=UPI003015692C